MYKRFTRKQRLFLGALGIVAILTVASGWMVLRAYRPAALKDRIVALLGDELESEVTLDSLEGSFFPRIVLSGGGLIIRAKGRTDVPPLISIEHFEIRASLGKVLRRPRHVSDVRLQGLDVHIPPNDHDRSDEDAKERDGAEGAYSLRELVIDRLEAPDAVLTLIPRKTGKPPKVFTVHHLVMESVGRGHTSPFIATLTNPIPKGEIETSGTFGPWNVASPARTPVAGTYVFAHADLDTIHGLAGILSSEGAFDGPLNLIQVHGTTSTPDFQVDAGGQPVPLTTRFDAVVDGSNGDTILDRVDATFLNTALIAKGAVIGLEGAQGHRIEVNVTMEKGRVEDLLRLAVNSPQPLLNGGAGLQARLVVPPGKDKVLDKLELRGAFGLTQATFTNPSVQTKIVGLSRRGQGTKADEPVEDVVSNLRGRFVIDHAVASFSQLRFDVPGAAVALTGRYGLRSAEIDFRGSLRLQATLSQAAGGGIKGFFLKAVDPFFKKEGSGAVLPIKITGSRKDPKFGLNLFSGKK